VESSRILTLDSRTPNAIFFGSTRGFVGGTAQSIRGIARFSCDNRRLVVCYFTSGSELASSHAQKIIDGLNKRRRESASFSWQSLNNESRG